MADEEEFVDEPEEEQVDEELGEEEEVAEEEEEVAEADAGDIMDEEVHSPVAEDEEDEAEAGDEEEEDDFPHDSMIEDLGIGDKEKFVVRLRQQLRTAKRACRFVAELSDLIDSRRAEDKDTIFEDFDISQNLMPAEQFEGMCSALADSKVQVERFRAFGSPALDDQAALLLAGWLVAVSPDMAPFEMHLSDCAIQTEGFLELTKAFTENEAFPPKDPRYPDKGPIPLYLRLEGNYIEDAEIQARVDDGTFMSMRKNDRPYHTTDHKVRLLLRDDGKFGQRQGTPPAPEDAAPPKRVSDKGNKGKDSKGKDKGKGKGKDKDKGKGKGKGKEKDKDKGKGKSKDAPWERDRRDDRRDSGKAKSKSAAAALPARGSWEREKPAPWSSRDSHSRDSKHDRPVGAASSWSSSSRSAAGGRGADVRDSRESRDNRGSARDSRGSDVRDDDRGNRGNRGISTRYTNETRGRDVRHERRATPENSRHSQSARSSVDARESGRQNLKRPLEQNGRADEGKRQRQNDRPTTTQAAPARRVLTESRNAKPAVASRPSGKAAAKGGKAGGRSKENGKLPAPWEEHWSEEYGLHYFWNSKSGDSTWERPT